MKNRVYWIDIARAIGMLLIIIGHSLGKYTLTPIGSVVFMVNVTIFFVLSGYLYKQKKFSKQAVNLCYNVLIPYIITAIGIVLISEFVNHFGQFKIFTTVGGAENIIERIFFGMGTNVKLIFTNHIMPQIGAVWFLVAFFWTNIIFNVLHSLLTGKKLIFYFSTIIVAVFGVYLTKWGMLPWSLNAALIGVFFMGAGSIIKGTSIFNRHKMIIFLFCLVLCVFSSLQGYFWFDVAYTQNVVYAALGGISGSIAIMLMSQGIEVLNIRYNLKFIIDALAWFGRYSLPVLCVHIIELSNTRGAEIISNHLMGHSSLLIMFVIIIYRIVFVTIGVIVLRHLPILKSIYFNREFPFYWQKRDS
ncbi:acyltransferase family protein [Paucilactobacillus nenjiangensis]|uniref:acyltransferase family protein n=1 Tax=Paucilactobacillus nenjiangensis TaxID=1296540 RepID=UPI0016806BBE|nr:acyltransferase family protein [Paucilactobacillus nenjiangensis]